MGVVGRFTPHQLSAAHGKPSGNFALGLDATDVNPRKKE
jgi:hypothetical protein